MKTFIKNVLNWSSLMGVPLVVITLILGAILQKESSSTEVVNVVIIIGLWIERLSFVLQALLSWGIIFVGVAIFFSAKALMDALDNLEWKTSDPEIPVCGEMRNVTAREILKYRFASGLYIGNGLAMIFGVIGGFLSVLILSIGLQFNIIVFGLTALSAFVLLTAMTYLGLFVIFTSLNFLINIPSIFLTKRRINLAGRKALSKF